MTDPVPPEPQAPGDGTVGNVIVADWDPAASVWVCIPTATREPLPLPLLPFGGEPA